MRIARLTVASLVVGLGAALVADPAAAQGKSDSATATVTANVPALVKISKLDNITFNDVQFTGTRTQSDQVCVWTNTGAEYNLTVDSTNGGYTLESPDTNDEISYDVAWAPDTDAGGFSGGTTVSDGTPSSFDSSPYSNPACQGGENAELFIQLQTGSGPPVTEGTYTDELTLTVEPK